MPTSGLLQQVVVELERSGIDLRALGFAWARTAPVVAIVPAFGLRALPGPVRSVMALSLAACIAPALRAEAYASSSWAWGLLASAAKGLPVAIAAAVPLWAATMAGGAVDAVRGSNDTVSIPVIEGRPTQLAVPMALLAAIGFLGSGGPARVASALARNPALDSGILLRTALDIASGIEIAIAVAAPVLCASIIIELSSALMAKAAVPAQIHVLLAPLRSFTILGMTALVFERIVALLNALQLSRPAP